MDKERKQIAARMYLAFGLLFLLPAAIFLQLLRINLVEGKQLRELWSAQAVDFVPIPAQRGSILDASGKIMVTNAAAYTVAVDPLYRGMNEESLRLVCETLAAHTPQRADFYMKKITSAPRGSRYVVLEKNLGIPAYEAMIGLGMRAIIVEEQFKRRYNYDSLAAHVLGYVNHRVDGMMGVESFYNDELKGEDGSQQVRRDRANRIKAIVGSPRKKPTHGYNLHTTIDVHMQAIVEEELRNGILRSRANYGTAILMDPRTGAIKAMANYPSFNPNAPASSDTENRRNFAISDMIEPGSTFKLVTAIAATEQKVIAQGELFETPKTGQKLIHGQWMRDHDPLGTMNFTQVIAKSSNVATADIAMRLQPNTFYQYVRNLGFGSPANVDLPNEESGRLRRPFEWSQVTLPWMSVGYEVQTTPMQLAQAYAAFANGGAMMRPYVVEKITDGDGNIIRKHEPTFVRQVAEKQTIEALMPVFEKVVSDSGTAGFARINGLRIGGKTGTAQKYMDGAYRTKYRASFVGFFPIEAPKYVFLVILDEPKTQIYGGVTAGPIFRNVAVRLVGLDDEVHFEGRQLFDAPLVSVPNVVGMERGKAKAILASQGFTLGFTGQGSHVVAQTPAAGTKVERKSTIAMEVGATNIAEETSPKIPSVIGLSMRQAAHLIQQAGFQVQMHGSGTVYQQFPKADQSMPAGGTVSIRGKAISMETVASAK